MAYQFVHMEVYSRKGRDGRGVDFVLAEAERRPDACLHVANPLPPEVVFGVDVGAVRRRHDDRAQAAVTVLANGRRRAIRKDQNTLVTIVASHPATMDSVRSNPVIAKAVAEWESLTVAWLREQYDDQLVSVVRHVDERHPHLHAYVVPDDPELRAGRLHPGQEAKRAVVAAGPVDGEDAKAVNRRGDIAYRAAMRDWQDSYWNAAGLPSGLTRLGPGRRRLTREEWQAEKTQVQAVRTARAKFAHLEARADAFITKTRCVADTAIRQARDEAAELHAAVMAEQVAAKRMHDAAEARLRKAPMRNQIVTGIRPNDLSRGRKPFERPADAKEIVGRKSHFTIQQWGRGFAINVHRVGCPLETIMVETAGELNRVRQRLSDDGLIGVNEVGR